MNTHLSILIVAAAALLCAMAPMAQACDGWGYGYDYGYLYNSLEYHVPYFAAHPPVYYSYPVPRSYGYSPFAYPPYVMTPEVVDDAAAQPAVILNPYVPSSGSQKAKVPEDRSASSAGQPQPLVIVNPYVTSGRAVASAE